MVRMVTMERRIFLENSIVFKSSNIVKVRCEKSMDLLFLRFLDIISQEQKKKIEFNFRERYTKFTNYDIL